VELLTGGMVVAGDLASTLELPRWRAAAARLGIRQSADRVVLGLAPGSGVRLLHHPTGREEEVAADAVVVASHGEPDDGLWRALRGGPLEVHRIGDCRTPRTAAAATVEGERVAALVAAPAR
jgi:hypothetical protein